MPPVKLPAVLSSRRGCCVCAAPSSHHAYIKSSLISRYERKFDVNGKSEVEANSHLRAEAEKHKNDVFIYDCEFMSYLFSCFSMEEELLQSTWRKCAPSLKAFARVHTLSLSKLRAEVIDKLDYKRCLSSFRIYSRSLTCEVKVDRELNKIGKSSTS